MTLTIPQANFTVTEGDEGSSQVLSILVTTDITQPRIRAAIFELVISDQTTTNSDEYSLSTPLVVIPADFNGTFSSSIDVTLHGDNVIEDSERVVICVRPLISGDMVDFVQPSGSDAITIYIEDNDGKIFANLIQWSCWTRGTWDWSFCPLLRHCPLLGGSKNELLLWERGPKAYPLLRGCPFLKGCFIGGSTVLL